MNNIHIKSSYTIWKTSEMKRIIHKRCLEEYNSDLPCAKLNRTYESMYIEWWLHNIGYYLTKPFCHIEFINKINLRCKDVDINEWL